MFHSGLNRYQSLMLTLGFLTTLNMHLLLFSYSPLVPSIIQEMHLTDAEAGLLFSACMLTLMLLRIPWGLLCDKKGFKMAVGMALAVMGFFGLLRGFAGDYLTLLVFQFFLGMGFAAVIPCLPKLVASWFPQEKAGLATGICMAGFPIGDMLGLSITPHLLTALGNWRNVFQIYGVWALVLVILWWILARENTEKVTKQEACQHTSVKRDFAILLRMREVWLLTGLFICAAGCYDTILMWFPHMLESRGVLSTTAGIMASMLPLGFLVASPVVGASSDMVGLRKPFILILGLISGPAIYATGTILDPGIYVTTFFTGFCTIGVLTLVLAIPIELPQTAPFVASALGLISSIGNIGSFLLPTIVGQIKDTTGSFLFAMLILGIIGECMLVLGLMLRETGRKKIG